MLRICTRCGVDEAVFDETGNCPSELGQCDFQAPVRGAPRGSRTHYLKCWPEPFRAMKLGLKPFEFREDDRDYRVGDVLVAREFELGKYSGDQVRAVITYKLINGMFGVPHGYCVLGLRL